MKSETNIQKGYTVCIDLNLKLSDCRAPKEATAKIPQFGTSLQA